MRWYWIDRFTEFKSGQYAVAIKNVTLGEEYLLGNFFNYPVMPNPLILEGMAQTAGMLMGEASNFHDRLALAKVSKVEFFASARPGDRLTYRAEITSQRGEAALIKATSHIDDQLQAQAEFYLAILGEKFQGQQLFRPGDFARLVRVLGVYDVAVDPEDNPLEIPERVLAAEREAELAADQVEGSAQ